MQLQSTKQPNQPQQPYYNKNKTKKNLWRNGDGVERIKCGLIDSHIQNAKA
jgi:hypothetical protein